MVWGGVLAGLSAGLWEISWEDWLELVSEVLLALVLGLGSDNIRLQHKTQTSSTSYDHHILFCLMSRLFAGLYWQLESGQHRSLYHHCNISQ